MIEGKERRKETKNYLGFVTGPGQAIHSVLQDVDGIR